MKRFNIDPFFVSLISKYIFQISIPNWNPIHYIFSRENVPIFQTNHRLTSVYKIYDSRHISSATSTLISYF